MTIQRIYRFDGGPYDGLVVYEGMPAKEGFEGKDLVQMCEFMSRNGTVGKRFRLASPKQREDLATVKIDKDTGKMDKVPPSLDLPMSTYEVSSNELVDGKANIILTFKKV